MFASTETLIRSSSRMRVEGVLVLEVDERQRPCRRSSTRTAGECGMLLGKSRGKRLGSDLAHALPFALRAFAQHLESRSGRDRVSFEP